MSKMPHMPADQAPDGDPAWREQVERQRMPAFPTSLAWELKWDGAALEDRQQQTEEPDGDKKGGTS